ncbi:hypothetical protein RhiirA1_467870 [Rhizophagus irregularis]|uniref:Uncharacterized protein n=1 Tax=Rhizophagus irregularis TaxID=588596 RepID=A0A2I1FDP4_9GLOM|nr:hypothetical protein RhiirA1_467870 [Rhizophagus irregularis]PKY32478.1 hypothetical protein RhiirB3_450679 [Rhizophagus irregularis]
MKYSSLESSQQNKSNGSKIAFLELILDEKLITLDILQENFGAILKTLLQDQYQTSISANSSTSENNKINIFANILSFFKDFSIGAAATAFQHKKNDMSFTLDYDDTNSADDDLDSLDIVISDNTSHQSQQVQPLITVTITPFQTLLDENIRRIKSLNRKLR